MRARLAAARRALVCARPQNLHGSAPQAPVKFSQNYPQIRFHVTPPGFRRIVSRVFSSLKCGRRVPSGQPNMGHLVRKVIIMADSKWASVHPRNSLWAHSFRAEFEDLSVRMGSEVPAEREAASIGLQDMVMHLTALSSTAIRSLCNGRTLPVRGRAVYLEIFRDGLFVGSETCPHPCLCPFHEKAREKERLRSRKRNRAEYMREYRARKKGTK